MGLTVYPNPFNPRTTHQRAPRRGVVRARSPSSTPAATGSRSCSAATLPAGTHELRWDGRDDRRPRRGHRHVPGAPGRGTASRPSSPSWFWSADLSPGRGRPEGDMARPLLTFLHLAKTGGRSVETMLRSTYGRGLLPRPGVAAVAAAGRDGRPFLVATYDHDDFRRLARLNPWMRAVGGHAITLWSNLHELRPVRYFAFLRDPLKRAASHYQFHVADTPQPLDWDGVVRLGRTAQPPGQVLHARRRRRRGHRGDRAAPGLRRSARALRRVPGDAEASWSRPS